MPPKLQGWGGFAAWASAGTLLGFSVLGAASIGLFVLPAALIALAASAFFVRPWPEMAGVLPGLGSLGLFVGALNLHSVPCPSSGVSYGGPGVAGSSSSCGGLDPVPWLVAGAVLTAVGVALYLARSR